MNDIAANVVRGFIAHLLLIAVQLSSREKSYTLALGSTSSTEVVRRST